MAALAVDLVLDVVESDLDLRALERLDPDRLVRGT